MFGSPLFSNLPERTLSDRRLFIEIAPRFKILRLALPAPVCAVGYDFGWNSTTKLNRVKR